VFLWAAAQTNIDTDVWVQKLTVLGISPNNLDIRRAKAWELREVNNIRDTVPLANSSD
jgi:hypothetical protein